MKNIKTSIFMFYDCGNFILQCHVKNWMKSQSALFSPQNFYTTPSQIEATFAASMNKRLGLLGRIWIWHG